MKKKTTCQHCPFKDKCKEICKHIEEILPSMERARVDPEDLPRLWRGMMLTKAILDHEDLLTQKQRQVVQLYYREQLQQKTIAEKLGISQQAINDTLQRARKKIGDFLKQRKPVASKSSQTT